MTQPPEDNQGCPAPYSSGPPANASSPYVPPAPYEIPPSNQQARYGQPAHRLSVLTERRQRLFLFGAIAIVLVLIAGSLIVRWQQQHERSSVPNGVVLSDPVDHFEITMPEGWIRPDDVTERGIHMLFGGSGDDEAVRGYLHINIAAPPVDLAEVRSTEPDTLKDLGDLVDTTVSTTYAGSDAVRFEYTDMSLEGKPQNTGFEAYLNHDGKSFRGIALVLLSPSTGWVSLMLRVC